MGDSPEVVILCGGRGTRLGTDADILPKPLVPVGGRPILWHIMSHYASYGLNRFVLCLGYRGEQIREYFLTYRDRHNDFTLGMRRGDLSVQETDAPDWEVTCADTGLDTQTGGRIARVRPYITGDTFLCTYGDGVSDIDLGTLLDFHRSHGRVATITGVLPQARWGELVLDGETSVSAFSEKPRLGPRGGAGYVNGGFFVFSSRIFDYLANDSACVLERGPMERLAADGELQVYRHDGFWQCMDVPKDRDMLDEHFARGGHLPARSRVPVAR
ncbi:MAG: glucose-1-phosphate cytidylyltransferase [Candidatus Limnocylindria bacterium]